MLSIHTHHPASHKLALIAGIAALVIVTFGISYVSMWHLWQTSDHRHGILVLPISAFLIWRLRHQLLDLPMAPDARGLLLVVPLAMVWLVARLAGVQVVEQIAALAMIGAGVAALAGRGVANKLLFPLLFLLLATPLGESLVPHLMVITADISAGLLRISGVPLLRDGQYISLPGGEFVVADVCSGLRYLVSGVMISMLYGYLTYTSVWKRVVLVAVTAMTMIITNGVRAYIVMAVASATRMEYLGGRDHVYFGWLLFGVFMMLIMWVGARYADVEASEQAARSDTMASRASHSILPIIAALGLVMLAVTLVPLQADFGENGAMIAAAAALFVFLFLLVRHKGHERRSDSDRSRTVALRLGWAQGLTAIATLAIFVATPRFVLSIENRVIDFVGDGDLKSVVPCAYAGPWQNDWHPRFENADLEHSGTFICDGKPVSVYVGAYASALQGKELISSSHYVVPPDWDRVIDASSYTIGNRDGGDHRIGEIQVDAPAYKAVIWHWYEIDKHIAPGTMAAKAYQVLALLRGRPSGGRVVVIETLVDTDIQQTRERLESVAISIIETEPR